MLGLPFAFASHFAPGPVPAPIDDIREYAADFEIAQIEEALASSAVGSAESVERELRPILAETQPDELLVTGHFHDHIARLRSFEITATVRERLEKFQIAPHNLRAM